MPPSVLSLEPSASRTGITARAPWSCARNARSASVFLRSGGPVHWLIVAMRCHSGPHADEIHCWNTCCRFAGKISQGGPQLLSHGVACRYTAFKSRQKRDSSRRGRGIGASWPALSRAFNTALQKVCCNRLSPCYFILPLLISSTTNDQIGRRPESSRPWFSMISITLKFKVPTFE